MSKPSQTGTMLEALRDVRRELGKWDRKSPSETGHLVENIPAGHPLHSAVATLEKFYGGVLPRPAIKYWRRLLRFARNEDEKAADEADELLDWVTAKIRGFTAKPPDEP